jgi:hypothetical protein
MRRMTARSAFVCLIAAFVLPGRLLQTDAAGQRSQQPSSTPVYVEWPLPSTGKAYGTIDGKRLCGDVR